MRYLIKSCQRLIRCMLQTKALRWCGLIDGESDAGKAAMATYESSAHYRAPAITSYKMATYRPHASAYCSLALP